MDLKSGKNDVSLDMGDATGDFYNGRKRKEENGKGKGTEEDTDVRKKAVVVARLVFVHRAEPDGQKGCYWEKRAVDIMLCNLMTFAPI